MDAQAQEALDFWFLPPDNPDYGQSRMEWFRKDDAFDAQIRARFGALIDAAIDGGLREWDATPHGALARLIVLDQFTRNVFRGQPASFAADAQALALAVEGIERGHDQAVPPMARIFCYLPLEHAEDATLQARNVALFQALRDAPGAEPRAFFDGTLDYALRHQDVIARFGRFPHRNAILGRTSTAAELDYLAQPGAGF